MNNGNFKNVKSMLPFLEEEDLELLAQKIMDSPDQMVNNIRLESLYPFLDDDYLDQIFSQAVEKGHDINKMLPFVSDDALSNLVDEIVAGKIANIGINTLLPFLDEEDIGRLASFIKQNGGSYNGTSLSSLLPFMDDDDVDKEFKEAWSNGKDFSKYLPFASDEALSDLVNEIIAGKVANIRINSLLPFLDDDDISRLAAFIRQNGGSYNGTSLTSLLPFMDDDDVDKEFKEAWSNGKDFSKYLPFASDEALSEAVDAYINGNTSIDVNVLYPFLEEDDLKKLFRYEINKKNS